MYSQIIWDSSLSVILDRRVGHRGWTCTNVRPMWRLSTTLEHTWSLWSCKSCSYRPIADHSAERRKFWCLIAGHNPLPYIRFCLLLAVILLNICLLLCRQGATNNWAHLSLVNVTVRPYSMAKAWNSHELLVLRTQNFDWLMDRSKYEQLLLLAVVDAIEVRTHRVPLYIWILGRTLAADLSLRHGIVLCMLACLLGLICSRHNQSKTRHDTDSLNNLAWSAEHVLTASSLGELIQL